ncbi:hypothetical protein LV84_03781 [Algoriphagus ratkowskyi]|uniref:Uncharacterized protein n=1 Tax=Algoriphagus ratkowskyi TaxID=57028 RepID=A0A2W7QRT5_9BACT|nr:hypothetical protein LV84_03781 [Algoriphagus ratkowskyi]
MLAQIKIISLRKKFIRKLSAIFPFYFCNNKSKTYLCITQKRGCCRVIINKFESELNGVVVQLVRMSRHIGKFASWKAFQMDK